MHIFALSISVLVTTAGNGARFCATSAPKIGPKKMLHIDSQMIKRCASGSDDLLDIA